MNEWTKLKLGIVLKLRELSKFVLKDNWIQQTPDKRIPNGIQCSLTQKILFTQLALGRDQLLWGHISPNHFDSHQTHERKICMFYPLFTIFRCKLCNSQAFLAPTVSGVTGPGPSWSVGGPWDVIYFLNAESRLMVGVGGFLAWLILTFDVLTNGMDHDVICFLKAMT